MQSSRREYHFEGLKGFGGGAAIQAGRRRRDRERAGRKRVLHQYEGTLDGQSRNHGPFGQNTISARTSDESRVDSVNL